MAKPEDEIAPVKKTATKKSATKKKAIATKKAAATKKSATKKSVTKKTTTKKKASKSTVPPPSLPPDTPITDLLGESFLRDLVEDWQTNGAGVIEECRLSKPEAYLRLIAAYAPKELRKQLRPFGNIDDETLLKELNHVLGELKELGIETSPGSGA
ncbi:MAG: hypothetical protein EP347_05705 [Alphaproteobacteria bacterium]|nr:MAG: hypothetical protein EP347_05705 [Alphaproteobacteria bacterium]